ncbi:hypothetical protein KC343_g5966 [Hortaea werneckii]|uniref:F-box domain-containing protein n=1 Tax=Hortaea werneckii TaxID=91943 RepID=A0A3M7GGU5_HORWE|nr:hypothetical protein KC323_g7344 [Hortaea werneckii]KAI7256644.1 hypothetical protein KC352_g11159 [Hortaea werneckii]KAI7347438.1 hypothetical protein KC320_g7239 [Hortaea werneckii]KAI7570068.1 hypothetical protein KC317_g2792 [Hortaea werneckii]KAI7624041.1 hypothetical protein KC346_g2409 [Hortaea werneckii]
MSNHSQAFTLPEKEAEIEYTPAWKYPLIRPKHTHVKSAGAPDQDQAFRFLDLPAEMRNLVYRELLVWPSNRLERCWPQILRTCRQVNDEAKEIIYTDNAAKVKVFIKGMGENDPNRIFWYIDYRSGRQFDDCDDDNDDDIDTFFSENLREYNFRCSPFLLKQASVQVDIWLKGDEGDGRPQDVAIILSRVVYTLSSAFLHCQKLEKLSIRFYGLEVEVGDEFGKEVLWSLSKLGLPASALSIKGLHANETTNWAEVITNCDPGSPSDVMLRLYQAHVGSQRLEDSLDLNEPAINIVTQAAYDENDKPIGGCQDIYREEFISLSDYILDHEEEKCLIEITERLELWVKTTIQALERDAEVAKARIDAITHKVRKVAGLLEI